MEDTIKEVLLKTDVFRDIECEIDGEVKLMTEYRILLEPDSELEKAFDNFLIKINK